MTTLGRRVALAAASLQLCCSAAGRGDLQPPFTYSVPCNVASYDGLQLGDVGLGCLPAPTKGGTAGCLRHGEDDFVSPAEAAQLLAMMQAGFARSRRSAGPTILDVNTGYLREGGRVVNIYKDELDKATGRVTAPAVAFNDSDLALYRSVFDRIRGRIVAVFNLTSLFFTAPTFVTRIVGAEGWEAEDIHDEYWHPHVDMANTRHYHYSGLLYLSSHGDNFSGGEFAFLKRRGGSADDEDAEDEHVVLPRSGRLLAFSSGHENLHVVRRVTSGTRYVFSMWFSCDPRREFTTFLDNKAHSGRRVKVSNAGKDGDGDDDAAAPASKKGNSKKGSTRRPKPSRRAQQANSILAPDLQAGDSGGGSRSEL